MYEESKQAEVELLRSIADCPPLPAELRDRVLNAAAVSHSRQMLRRRVLRAACIGIVLVGLSGTIRTIPKPSLVAERELARYNQAAENANAIETTGNRTHDAGLSAWLIADGLGEWDLVDAIWRVRRNRSRVFGRTL